MSAVAIRLSLSLACRFTVRDIGFVDLQGRDYSLVVQGVSPFPLAETLKHRLRDSNLQVVGRNTSSDDSNHEGWTVELVDRGGRRLNVGHMQNGESVEELEELIEQQIFPPSVQRIASKSTQCFANLIAFEGTNPEANLRLRTVVQESQQALRRIEALLPRPLAHPVASTTIGLEDRASEQMLLWSLGVDETTKEDAIDQESEDSRPPVLAIVYGRGKLAGPVMVGEEIRLKEALAQLALVGESCECETDRKWLEERTLPMNWPASLRKAASDDLGFDPESPLVQAEVIRIVSRGPTSSGRADGAQNQTSGSDDIEKLLLGYDETQIIPSAIASGNDPTSLGTGEALDSSETGSSTATEPNGVRAQVVKGSGWDFDSTPESEAMESSTFDEAAQASDNVGGVTPTTNSPESDASKPEVNSSGNEEAVPDTRLEPEANRLSASNTVTIGLVAIALVVFVAFLMIWFGGRR